MAINNIQINITSEYSHKSKRFDSIITSVASNNSQINTVSEYSSKTFRLKNLTSSCSLLLHIERKEDNTHWSLTWGRSCTRRRWGPDGRRARNTRGWSAPPPSPPRRLRLASRPGWCFEAPLGRGQREGAVIYLSVCYHWFRFFEGNACRKLCCMSVLLNQKLGVKLWFLWVFIKKYYGISKHISEYHKTL